MRVDGYASIRDYATIGDGRGVGLVARDGAIDWLALPMLDSPALFSALLDAEKGGRFALEPEGDYEIERRYRPRTNVLETTFTTAEGSVRVTDSLNLQDGGLLPWSELARRVDGLSGTVRMHWRVEPRFRFGQKPAGFERRRGVPSATDGSLEVCVLSFDAGEPEFSSDAVEGRFATAEGGRALIALVATHDEPIPLPPRDEIDARIDRTAAAWERWLDDHSYEGPWADAVERSALALKLLICAPSGAIAAAPTTSLPERIGGPKNWDYRYAWVRDTAFTLDALMRLGFREQAHASLSWLLDAVRHTHPRLQVFYGLSGSVVSGQEELDLAGYRGSTPVRKGNGAAGQIQLGSYGDLLETVWLYVRDGNALNGEAGKVIADVCDFLCEIWRNDDSGIWELGDEKRPYTISKMSCWVALMRALKLVEAGQVPGDHAERWRHEADAVREYVERACWSEERRSYLFYAGGDELDAACLLAARNGFADPEGERMAGTIETLRRELGAGPLLYRYSGMQQEEGAFLACSFWLVEALARAGRVDEASELMEELLPLANDVGLYSEQIDPGSSEMLGNFPQGLTHLSLINAACLVAEAAEHSKGAKT